MHFYVKRYKSNEFLEIYSLTWKSKKSDLKIKKPKNLKPNFSDFLKKPKKPRFLKMGLDSPLYDSTVWILGVWGSIARYNIRLGLSLQLGYSIKPSQPQLKWHWIYQWVDSTWRNPSVGLPAYRIVRDSPRRENCPG